MQPGNAGSGFRSKVQRRILNRSSESLANFSAATRVGNGPKYCAFALQAADARGDGRARIRVVEDELDQRRKAQPQALVVGLGELAAQGFVEQERRLEVRAGRGPLDPAHAIAQVQLAALSLDGAEQALQAAAQVRGLADVRLAAFFRSAQHEHRRARRSGGEQLGVAVGNELNALHARDDSSPPQRHRGTEQTERRKQPRIYADEHGSSFGHSVTHPENP